MGPTDFKELPNEHKIQVGLSEERTKDLFERQFGIDTKHRSMQQWRNLVNTYGIETVMMKENMTKEQVENNCASFKERMKNMLKRK